MIESKFLDGELVWAKMPGFPYWPCMVFTSWEAVHAWGLPTHSSLKIDKNHRIVMFLDAFNYQRVPLEKIHDYSRCFDDYAKKVPPKHRKKIGTAIEQAKLLFHMKDGQSTREQLVQLLNAKTPKRQREPEKAAPSRRRRVSTPTEEPETKEQKQLAAATKSWQRWMRVLLSVFYPNPTGRAKKETHKNVKKRVEQVLQENLPPGLKSEIEGSFKVCTEYQKLMDSGFDSTKHLRVCCAVILERYVDYKWTDVNESEKYQEWLRKTDPGRAQQLDRKRLEKRQSFVLQSENEVKTAKKPHTSGKPESLKGSRVQNLNRKKQGKATAEAPPAAKARQADKSRSRTRAKEDVGTKPEGRRPRARKEVAKPKTVEQPAAPGPQVIAAKKKAAARKRKLKTPKDAVKQQEAVVELLSDSDREQKKRKKVKSKAPKLPAAEEASDELTLNMAAPTPLSSIWQANEDGNIPGKQYFVWDNDIFEDYSKSETISEQEEKDAGRRKNDRRHSSVQHSQIRSSIVSGDLDPHTMVRCENYCIAATEKQRSDAAGDISSVPKSPVLADTTKSMVSGRRLSRGPQIPTTEPYHVRVHPEASFVCDLHAHLAECEIIGFLGGKYDAETNTVFIQAAFPCRGLETDENDGSMDVEMDPGSEIELREIIRQQELQVVGWYHSHPQFQPDPSIRDIENQSSYQSLFKDMKHNMEPFVGLIVGTYDVNNLMPQSVFRYFHVRYEKVGMAPIDAPFPMLLNAKDRAYKKARISDEFRAAKKLVVYSSVWEHLQFKKAPAEPMRKLATEQPGSGRVHVPFRKGCKKRLAAIRVARTKRMLKYQAENDAVEIVTISDKDSEEASGRNGDSSYMFGSTRSSMEVEFVKANVIPEGDIDLTVKEILDGVLQKVEENTREGPESECAKDVINISDSEDMKEEIGTQQHEGSVKTLKPLVITIKVSNSLRDAIDNAARGHETRAQARNRREKKAIVESLRTSYGPGVRNLVEQCIALVDYYSGFNRRVNMQETWKSKSKFIKIRSSLATWAAMVDLDSDEREDFLDELVLYLELSWDNP